jgi:hypothetical protein
MIQPLRSAHRLTFSVLAVVLPALIFTGLIARHPDRNNSTKPSLYGRYLKSTNGTVMLQIDKGTLRVSATDRFNSPETLVYLSARSSIDSKARLLGRLNSEVLNNFQLPESEENSRFVIFYSPALSSVVDGADVAGVAGVR